MESAAWTVRVYNGGAGLGTVHQVDYVFAIQPATSATVRADSAKWHNRQSVIAMLNGFGLAEDEDFALEKLGEGFPLAPVKQASEGLELAAFSARALSDLATFDVRLRIFDLVGDVHERTIRCLTGVPGRPFG